MVLVLFSVSSGSRGLSGICVMEICVVLLSTDTGDRAQEPDNGAICGKPRGWRVWQRISWRLASRLESWSSGTMQELPLTSAKPLEFVRTGHKRQQFEKLKLQVMGQGSRGFLKGGYLRNGHESTHQPWQENCWSFRSCLQICTAIWSLRD